MTGISLAPKESPVSATGAFTFVLRSHLPYARLAGHWPHEVASVEATTETYLPPTQAVYDLRDDGIDPLIGLCLTLILPLAADTLDPMWVIERFGELPRASVDDDDLEEDDFDDDFEDDDLEDDLEDDDLDEEDEDYYDDDPDEGDDLDD
jgi:hypothetical protein